MPARLQTSSPGFAIVEIEADLWLGDLVGTWNRAKTVAAAMLLGAAASGLWLGSAIGAADGERFEPVRGRYHTDAYDIWHGETTEVFDRLQGDTSAPLLQLMQNMIRAGGLNRNQAWEGSRYYGSGIIYPGQQLGGRWEFEYNFDITPRKSPEYRLRVLGSVCAIDSRGSGLAYCKDSRRHMYGPKQTTSSYNALLDEALYRYALYWYERNTYDRGSVSDVELVAKDANGLPAELTGRASFDRGEYNKPFKASLIDGKVACIDVDYFGLCKAVPTTSDASQIIAARKQRQQDEARADQESRRQSDERRKKDLGPCLVERGLQTPTQLVTVVDGYGNYKRTESRPGPTRMIYSNVCNRAVTYSVYCLGVELPGTVGAHGTFDTPPIFCRVVARR